MSSQLLCLCPTSELGPRASRSSSLATEDIAPQEKVDRLPKDSSKASALPAPAFQDLLSKHAQLRQILGRLTLVQLLRGMLLPGSQLRSLPHACSAASASVKRPKITT